MMDWIAATLGAYAGLNNRPLHKVSIDVAIIKTMGHES